MHSKSSKKRRLLVGDDGVVFESIVVNNDELYDAESMKKKESLAIEAS